jgi:hypothetical protein
LTAPNAPWPLLSAAPLVLVVLSASLPQVAAAVPVVRALHRHLSEQDGGSLGLLLVGGGDQRPRAVAEQLHAPVVASLPADARSAQVLSRGGGVRLSWPLMRAAAAAHYHITRQLHRQVADAATPQAEQVVTHDL